MSDDVIADTYPYPDHGWTCFHCGEEFSIATQRSYHGALTAAREHFGAPPDGEPLCKIGALPHAELVRRVREAEEAAREAIEARDEADAQAERALGELSSLGSRFKGARTVYDAFCMFDSMEGRALAAEENAMPAIHAPEITPVFRRFVRAMADELRANEHKGDRLGWLTMDERQAVSEVLYHAAKLAYAARKFKRGAAAPAVVLEYAADVANCALMVADVCGVLEPWTESVEGTAPQ